MNTYTNFQFSPVDADKNLAFIREESKLSLADFISDFDDEDPFDAAFFDNATNTVGSGTGLIW